MWEFPGGQVDGQDQAEARRLLKMFTGSRAQPAYLDTIAHTFSHFHALYHTYTLQLRTRGRILAKDDTFTWTPAEHLEQHALSTAQRRIAKRCTLL